MKTTRKNIIAVLAILLSLTTFSCNDSEIEMQRLRARSFSGTYTVNLKPRVKLENVTFRGETGMWYLTRKMRDDEKSETHELLQYNNSGTNITCNGKIIFIESK